MRVEQISIFLENKSGRLAEVARIMAEADVNIRALSLADTSDFGILRLIVDKQEKCEEALREHGFAVRKTDVVAVEVSDRPGGLHHILDILDKAGINVEYVYAFVRHSGDNAINIFRFENTDEAVKVLLRNGVKVIPGAELYSM